MQDLGDWWGMMVLKLLWKKVVRLWSEWLMIDTNGIARLSSIELLDYLSDS
jgi:hypothetical protein